MIIYDYIVFTVVFIGFCLPFYFFKVNKHEKNSINACLGQQDIKQADISALLRPLLFMLCFVYAYFRAGLPILWGIWAILFTFSSIMMAYGIFKQAQYNDKDNSEKYNEQQNSLNLLKIPTILGSLIFIGLWIYSWRHLFI